MIGFVFFIAFEIIATVGIIVGYLHEDRVVALERKVYEQLKRRIRIKKRDLCAKWLAEDGMIAIPRLAENEDIITLRK
ncbi:MAG: hypothetical protein J1E34_08835 [Oscillospiraceae bacterium]|nr:hypothetical protein [Oscillospiraceae bacterium]